jgi:hypothetical protein
MNVNVPDMGDKLFEHADKIREGESRFDRA